MTTPFPERPVDRLFDQVAARTSTPGGGAMAAVTAAAAAALVAMAARFSERQLTNSARIAAQADQIRGRALSLADDDATAYAAVLDAYSEQRDSAAPADSERVTRALKRAAEVPLELAKLAAKASALGVQLVEAGNPNLKGDAVTAVVLAESAARSAAALVCINAELGRLGPTLPREAVACAEAAGNARQQAVSKTPGPEPGSTGYCENRDGSPNA